MFSRHRRPYLQNANTHIDLITGAREIKLLFCELLSDELSSVSTRRFTNHLYEGNQIELVNGLADSCSRVVESINSKCDL